MILVAPAIAPPAGAKKNKKIEIAGQKYTTDQLALVRTADSIKIAALDGRAPDKSPVANYSMWVGFSPDAGLRMLPGKRILKLTTQWQDIRSSMTVLPGSITTTDTVDTTRAEPIVLKLDAVPGRYTIMGTAAPDRSTWAATVFLNGERIQYHRTAPGGLTADFAYEVKKYALHRQTPYWVGASVFTDMEEHADGSCSITGKIYNVHKKNKAKDLMVEAFFWNRDGSMSGDPVSGSEVITVLPKSNQPFKLTLASCTPEGTSTTTAVVKFAD
jgi:hypothetical protein